MSAANRGDGTILKSPAIRKVRSWQAKVCAGCAVFICSLRYNAQRSVADVFEQSLADINYQPDFILLIYDVWCVMCQFFRRLCVILMY
jgi:hypothetical protein